MRNGEFAKPKTLSFSCISRGVESRTLITHFCAVNCLNHFGQTLFVHKRDHSVSYECAVINCQPVPCYWQSKVDQLIFDQATPSPVKGEDRRLGTDVCVLYTHHPPPPPPHPDPPTPLSVGVVQYGWLNEHKHWTNRMIVIIPQLHLQPATATSAALSPRYQIGLQVELCRLGV